jgi:hypothetical protein
MRRMGCAVLLVGILLAAPATNAVPQPTPQPWPSLLGSGLLTLQDAATLPPGHFTVALTVDNKDRDPLGLDLVDGAFTLNLGVTPWAELYMEHVFSRSVAVPDTPVLPPPPLDVLVAPGMPVPSRPYYSLYSPVPYVDDSGPIRFGSDVPGEGILGVKVRAFEPKAQRPGLAWSLGVKFPLTQSLRDLQAGSGTGSIDFTLRTIGEWRRGRWSFVTSAGFTRVGKTAYPDRRIESKSGTLSVTDEPLLLPHRVDVGVGVRRDLGPRLAAVAEGTTVFEVGRRTRIVDRAQPIDVLSGLQFRWRRVRATAGLRYHGNALRSMQTRPAPLAGLVDLSHVSERDLTSYLDQVGLAGAGSSLRQGTHRLLVPPAAGPPLPPGARVIPPTYRIRSEHQVGFVLLWGWTF